MTSPLFSVVDSPLDAGTPVVLVHGVGSDHSAWSGVVAELAPWFGVLRYDLRGHGRSPLRELPYTLDAFVDDHLELMRLHGVDRCHLVGFSLGGLIAQAVALRAPQHVQRLVVIGAVAGRTAGERQRVRERLTTLRANGPGRTNAERWFTAAFLRDHPDRVAANLARQEQADPGGYLAAYEVLATNDLVDELRAIQAPTLAMTGEFDIGSPPRMSETIAASVPEGSAVILHGYKHAVLDEIPHIVAAKVGDFLTERTSAR